MAVASFGVFPDRARALSINSRSAWATDRPPKGPLLSEDVRFLLVHHSASRNGHTTADAPAILRSFYDFHTGPEKGWNDIAYNFLIDAGGGIWEGRAGSITGSVAGDATGGNQGYSQLVCLIGDFNAGNPTTEALMSVVSLLAWLADKHGIATAPGSTATFVSKGSNRWPEGTTVSTPTINGHRSMSKTSCPGDRLYGYVAGSLMADVTATRGGTPPTPATTTSSPPTSSTASVSTTTNSIETTKRELTTTQADPVPTTAPEVASTVASSSSSSSLVRTTIPSTTPDTAGDPLMPLAVGAGPTNGGSPLIWGGAGLATAGTALLAWRYHRMRP